jgi:hypothetical protein
VKKGNKSAMGNEMPQLANKVNKRFEVCGQFERRRRCTSKNRKTGIQIFV